MCRTIHKIALITNLTQSLNGFEFREDTQSGKGQYSMDGGTTWQNFSSGAEGDLTGTFVNTSGSTEGTYTIQEDCLFLPVIQNPSSRTYTVYVTMTIGGNTFDISTMQLVNQSTTYFTSKVYQVHAGDSISYRVLSGSNPVVTIGGYAYVADES